MFMLRIVSYLVAERTHARRQQWRLQVGNKGLAPRRSE